MQPVRPVEGGPTDAVPDVWPMVDVVIPVYNEAAILETTVAQVRAALAPLPYRSCITIADNASTDGTDVIARRLAADSADVRVLRLEEKGRGRALVAAWSTSDADIRAYTDADLSTSLDALDPLLAAIATGRADLAIGSRLVPGSTVNRGFKREFISRSYNRLLRLALRVGTHDAQCGFKAISARVARDLLPVVEDRGWFFDTELIVTVERSGGSVVEVPVQWVDDPDSSVALLQTAAEDLRGVVRMARSGRSGPRQAHPISPASAEHADQ
jgi:glycosyltransferase involved in cell wall biosynthesis